MAVIYGDRVQETFTTTGTGAVSLAGAVVGYQAFSAIVPNAGTCYYTATDGTNWEVGLGTYATSGNTLTRTTILASSNAGAAVSWAAGTKAIWLDFPAAAITTGNVNVRVITATASTSLTAGTKSVIMKPIGGGGGGGGTAATAGNVGGGGGAGAFAEAWVTAAAYGASQTITIGAGGIAGISGGTAPGGTGGTTSVGALITAAGGVGGNGDTSAGATAAAGGAGGVPGTGAIGGYPGQAGLNSTPGSAIEFSGAGGSTIRGAGAAGQGFAANAAGLSAAANTGAGAGGAASNGTAHAGGVGGSGVVLLIELS